ncbi:MAG: hypothetical protein ACTSV2_17500, partial [Candidatus Thorarchaeota archaeon]
MTVGEYIVSRCLRSVAFYIGVIFLTFILLIIPVLSQDATIMSVLGGDLRRIPWPPRIVEQDIVKWGYVQHPDVAEWINMCFRHMMNCLSGDFGHSYLTQRQVSNDLAERIANTALLVGMSLFTSLLIGSAL